MQGVVGAGGDPPPGYPIQAPEAPGQGAGRSQHRDSRRRSRREQVDLWFPFIFHIRLYSGITPEK